jgi:Holliday junction DNA helicase RuvA
MIPGVGKKTAARIILELKEKLVPVGTFSGEGKLNTRIETDALSALTNLGYNRSQANEAVKMACNISKNMSLEEVIREALKNLGKGGG